MPTNLGQNFLSPLGFQFIINKLPNTMFTVIGATLPGLVLENADLETPFKVIHLPDKIVYNDFVVRFKVDERMSNYKEILDWMVQLGRPEEFTDRQAGPFNAIGNYYSHLLSDATLTILDSAKKAVVEFRFKDVFPNQISDIEFTVTDSDINYVDATVNFKCLSFTIHTL